MATQYKVGDRGNSKKSTGQGLLKWRRGLLNKRVGTGVIQQKVWNRGYSLNGGVRGYSNGGKGNSIKE